MLGDIDGMTATLHDKSEAHRLIVAGYLAARRMGGHPGDSGDSGDSGEDENPTTPNPPAP